MSLIDSLYHAASVASLKGMAMLQDVRAVGMAALQLPRVLRQRECGTTRYLAERNARYPTLLELMAA